MNNIKVSCNTCRNKNKFHGCLKKCEEDFEYYKEDFYIEELGFSLPVMNKHFNYKYYLPNNTLKMKIINLKQFNFITKEEMEIK